MEEKELETKEMDLDELKVYLQEHPDEIIHISLGGISNERNLITYVKRIIALIFFLDNVIPIPVNRRVLFSVDFRTIVNIWRDSYEENN